MKYQSSNAVFPVPNPCACPSSNPVISKEQGVKIKEKGTFKNCITGRSSDSLRAAKRG